MQSLKYTQRHLCSKVLGAGRLTLPACRPTTVISYRRYASSGPRKSEEPLNQSPTSRRRPVQREEEQPQGSVRQSVLACGLAIALVIVLSNWDAGAEEPESTLEVAARSTLPLRDAPRAHYDLSEGNLAGAREEFIALLGRERIDESHGNLVAHSSTTWSSSPNGEKDKPSIIVMPKSTEEVSKIAKICHRRRIPMIAFSGGTSLEGTLAALNKEVCIDFKFMNKIKAIRSDDVDVTVQPGISYGELNEVLAKQDLFFPPDPGPGAQIGGMIAQGCSGTNAYRYGTMKDWVLGLELVLADGTIVRTRHRPRKSSSGYDLTRLICGSEGTLAFITEASLKVTQVPQNIKVAVVTFPTISHAVQTAIKLVRGGHQVEAMELLDEVHMRANNASGYLDREWPEKPSLFLKFAGTPQAVQELSGIAKKYSEESGCSAFVMAKDEEENEAIWAARKTSLWNFLATKKDTDDFLSADACVPISGLSKIIPDFQQRVQASGLVGACLGHVGDGNIHASVLFGPDEKEKAEKIIQDTQKVSIRLQGTVSGEHGIGYSFRDMVPQELGEPAVDLMRQIKFAMDPLCLLNAGKLFRTDNSQP